MEKEMDILVGYCGCKEFVKVSSTDEFASGVWVPVTSMSAIIQVQLDVAKEVSDRVPMSLCPKCIDDILLMGRDTKAVLVRGNHGLEITRLPARVVLPKGV